VKRCLFVIGAGSLCARMAAPIFEHMAEKASSRRPPSPRRSPSRKIKKVNDLDWTAISPPASIQPGERTGKFRLGLDQLIEDDKGKSRSAARTSPSPSSTRSRSRKHIRKGSLPGTSFPPWGLETCRAATSFILDMVLNYG
jgi:hypothetical protein